MISSLLSQAGCRAVISNLGAWFIRIDKRHGERIYPSPTADYFDDIYKKAATGMGKIVNKALSFK